MRHAARAACLIFVHWACPVPCGHGPWRPYPAAPSSLQAFRSSVPSTDSLPRWWPIWGAGVAQTFCPQPGRPSPRGCPGDPTEARDAEESAPGRWSQERGWPGPERLASAGGLTDLSVATGSRARHPHAWVGFGASCVKKREEGAPAWTRGRWRELGDGAVLSAEF